MKAYGTPLPQRRIDQAGVFWEVSSSCDWPEKNEFPLTFASATEMIASIKKKHGLPGCGPLVCYQLVIDMVACGLAEYPTLEDVANAIGSCNMGSLSGLELLGYIDKCPSGKYGDGVVATAFHDFVEDTQLLLRCGKVNMYLDFITAEHLLCKFSRMWGLGHYHDDV
jgi:hypothetical protein